MKQINTLLTRTNSHNSIVFNMILWSCSFVILLFLFSGNSAPSKIDYIYTSSFIFTLIIPISLNLYLLIPKFLKKEKYILFCVFFITNLFLFVQINTWFFNLVVTSFFKDYFFISYHNPLEIYFIFSIFFILSALIKLAEDWISLNRHENKTLKTQNQLIENQLYYLKGQINPHFLFNSLNVLYSLAIDKKHQITDAILQLSDILRYVIYDIDAGKISVEKEIELLKNYIEFEKNRHIKNSTIKFDYSIDEDLEIYPMLLLPLLENSFKHGLKSGVKNPFIDIQLKTKNQNLNFTIINNYKEIINPDSDNNKGIGLKNIQKNLAIVYLDKHQFSIEEKENIFTVNLKINL